MWSHRGVSGAPGCSTCRVRPRRLAAPRCWTERSLNPRCSPWQGAQPLSGWFSRQIRDATPVSSPAAAPRHCRHAWQSTLCRDGRSRREATGSSPGAVGTRHWQAHLAVNKQRRRVHGHIPRGIAISGESTNPPGVGKEGKKRYRVVGTWGTCLDALQHPGPPLLAMRIATATSITRKRRAQTVPAAQCSPRLYFGWSSFLRG